MTGARISPAMVQAAEAALKKSLELQSGYRAATVAALRAGLDAMDASGSSHTAGCIAGVTCEPYCEVAP